ncbi:MAG TPA: hypothetical protein GXX40_08920 [Firmicutes bacterium]|nr:hypothetical protein [Bacillota bacterium]
MKQAKHPPIRVNAFASFIVPGLSPDEGYCTLVQDISDEGIALGLPMERGRYVRVPEESRVRVEVASGRTVYAFDTHVLRVSEGVVPLVWVAWPEQYQRMERRHFVRAICSVDLTLIAPAKGGVASIDLYAGETVDLSAGGAMILTQAPLDVGDVVNVDLHLSKSRSLRVRGEVLRVEQLPRFRGQRRRVAMRFMDVKPSDEDEIYRFTMKVLCEQRRRGLV